MSTIGTSSPRIDGADKVRGTAPYAFEHVSDALYLWPITATVARGRVTSVDSSVAVATDGVELVLTVFDAPRLADTSDGRFHHPPVPRDFLSRSADRRRGRPDSRDRPRGSGIGARRTSRRGPRHRLPRRPPRCPSPAEGQRRIRDHLSDRRTRPYPRRPAGGHRRRRRVVFVFRRTQQPHGTAHRRRDLGTGGAGPHPVQLHPVDAGRGVVSGTGPRTRTRADAPHRTACRGGFGSKGYRTPTTSSPRWPPCDCPGGPSSSRCRGSTCSPTSAIAHPLAPSRPSRRRTRRPDLRARPRGVGPQRTGQGVRRAGGRLVADDVHRRPPPHRPPRGPARRAPSVLDAGPGRGARHVRRRGGDGRTRRAAGHGPDRTAGPQRAGRRPGVRQAVVVAASRRLSSSRSRQVRLGSTPCARGPSGRTMAGRARRRVVDLPAHGESRQRGGDSHRSGRFSVSGSRPPTSEPAPGPR